MSRRDKSTAKQKKLGELAKHFNIKEADLAKTGQEYRQPKILEGRPIQVVPDWIKDNDFAGMQALMPMDDMERLDKEIRAAIADVARSSGTPQVDRMYDDFANFWAELSKRPMPPVDASRPQSKK